MWWSINRERSNDAIGGSQGGDNNVSSGESSCACTEKIHVTADKELMIESPPSTHRDRDEGRRRFALFRRRRSKLGDNQRDELSSSESGNGSPHAETSVAADENASPKEDLNNDKVDEGNRDDGQSADIKEAGDSSSKFDWFGLLSKNKQQENERGCESSVDHQTSSEDSDEQLNRDAAAKNAASSGDLQHEICVDAIEDHIDLATPRRFSWFGLLHPLPSASSCMGTDSCAIQQGGDDRKSVTTDDVGEDKADAGEGEDECDDVIEGSVGDDIACCDDRAEGEHKVVRRYDKVEGKSVVGKDECNKNEGSGNDDIACADDNCSRYADDNESSAEVSTDENSPNVSMDTDDLVQGILRLQAQFDECSAEDEQEEPQHPAEDQEEEQRSPCCDHDLQCVASIDLMAKDNTESESFLGKETPISDEILALWRRRQRLKRKLQIDGPIPETSASVPKSMKMLATTQIEVGGGRNEENLRSLELEAHLIDTNSDERMTKMEIMSAQEKAHEDLLYDMFLQDCLLMAGEEPLDGYDNRGWYSITTTREDGEADLEYIDTSTMHVATEEEDAIANKSNRWLDGIENAALFIFAPDLYFIKQMNEESLQQPKYLPTSNKEDGEQDEGQCERGWFGKMFTNRRKLKDDVDFSQIPS